jgi:poly(A) polymerase
MTDAYHIAKLIVLKLHRAGFIAYFAGGWVRDYVMDHPSEDIDIATDATPAQIMDLFPHTVLVGLAFGVVIVVSDGHQFEVATFRKDLHYADGRHPEGIEMSTPREDALRRDFTINGMFYDPIEELIHDFVHGQDDIRQGIIRTIGDPYERFFEDRLRMLRAFRFSSRFNFSIDGETQEAIRQTAVKLFPAVAMERVWQEFNKMASYPGFDHALVQMHQLGLLSVIFPELESVHIKDLRQWVKSFVHFPRESPTIAYLMELFLSQTVENKIEIAKRIKGTNREYKWIEFMGTLEHAVARDAAAAVADPYEWSRLYSHLDCECCLQIIAARMSNEDRIRFLQIHQERADRLRPHILRLKENTPLINATFLKNQGINPGIKMGRLIREGERLAIQEDLHEPHAIFDRLQTLPVWNE